MCRRFGQAFNVPLVAISCAEGDIPSTLACWCSGRDWEGTGRRAESAGVRTPPASGAPAAAAAGAAAAAAAPGSTTATAAAQGLSTEGSVRIAIMDESYHPRQLSLSKKVKDALRGTAALYAVDSSSVYPVNMSGGAANKITSPEEFRRAQVNTGLSDYTGHWGQWKHGVLGFIARGRHIRR